MKTTTDLQRIVSTLPMTEKKRAEKLAQARDTSLSGLVRQLIVEETKRVKEAKAAAKANGNGAKAKTNGNGTKKASAKKTPRKRGPKPTATATATA